MPIAAEDKLVMEMTILGQPVPKGRPRFGRGHAYTPKRTREFEQFVGWMATKEMRGKPPETAPVRVVIRIGYKRDVDLDNVVKSVLDGLQGVAYVNDRQVMAITASKSERRILGGFTSVAVHRAAT